MCFKLSRIVPGRYHSILGTIEVCAEAYMTFPSLLALQTFSESTGAIPFYPGNYRGLCSSIHDFSFPSLGQCFVDQPETGSDGKEKRSKATTESWLRKRRCVFERDSVFGEDSVARRPPGYLRVVVCSWVCFHDSFMSWIRLHVVL